MRLDLKDSRARASLEDLLEGTDLLLTSSRPAALERLGLSWPRLRERFPNLCQVAIVGHSPPDENVPGHDLTYQASEGLIAAPQMPRTPVADLAGSERAVSAALALLFARERGLGAAYEVIALSEVAGAFAEPLRRGIAAPGGFLGGGFPGYGLYCAREGGYVAVAAIEPQFWKRLLQELGVSDGNRRDLERAFETKTAQEWEEWGATHDLPLVAVREDGFGAEIGNAPVQERKNTSLRGGD